MGGRGSYAAGVSVPNSYELDRTFYPDGKMFGVKILKPLPTSNRHGLPESAKTSLAYIKLNPNGTFREMRFYDRKHVLRFEIGYHPEEKLTGNRHQSVLHYHIYHPNFSKTKLPGQWRSEAYRLTKAMKRRYKKYFRGIKV